MLKLRSSKVVTTLIAVSLVLAASSAVANSRQQWLDSQGYVREIEPRGTGPCDIILTNHPLIDGREFEVVSTTIMTASWYGNSASTSFHGQRLHSERPFNECDATVIASNIYPPGTVLRISYRKATVLGVVQDSGSAALDEKPATPAENRIDLAKGAIQLLDENYDTIGLLPVVVEVMRPRIILTMQE